MSSPSHVAASRISAMWKAHKAKQTVRNYIMTHIVESAPVWIGIDPASGPDLSVEVQWSVAERADDFGRRQA